MKKTIILIIRAILYVVLIVSVKNIALAVNYGYTSENRIVQAYENTNSNKENIEKYNDSIIIEGNVSESLIDTLKMNMALIPESILSKFFDDNGKVILTTKNLAKEYYGSEELGKLNGLFYGKINTIYISASEKAINDSTLHEFGHALDHMTGWTTLNNKDFIPNIFNVEKDIFITHSHDEHHKSNEREYLAQAFMEYILDEERLKENTPKTYKYVKELVDSLESK